MSQEYLKQIEVVSTVQLPAGALLEDDFESTLLKWTRTGVGSLSVTRITTAAFNGDACMELLTRTAGSTNGDEVNAGRVVGLGIKPKINLRTRVQNGGPSADANKLKIKLLAAMDLRYVVFEVHITYWTQEISYRGSDNAMHVIAGVTAPHTVGEWSKLELQVNKETNKYEYLTYGGLRIDLTDIQGYSASTVDVESSLYVTLGAIQEDTASATNAGALYDDVVVTEL